MVGAVTGHIRPPAACEMSALSGIENHNGENNDRIYSQLE